MQSEQALRLTISFIAVLSHSTTIEVRRERYVLIGALSLLMYLDPSVEMRVRKGCLVVTCVQMLYGIG